MKSEKRRKSKKFDGRLLEVLPYLILYKFDGILIDFGMVVLPDKNLRNFENFICTQDENEANPVMKFCGTNGKTFLETLMR